MPVLQRLWELLAPACDRCGRTTVVEHERLVTMVPTVFDVVGRCPVCAETTSRCQVVDCLQ